MIVKPPGRNESVVLQTRHSFKHRGYSSVCVGKGGQTKILVLSEHMSQKVRYLVFGGDKCCREIQSRKRIKSTRGVGLES